MRVEGVYIEPFLALEYTMRFVCILSLMALCLTSPYSSAQATASDPVFLSWVYHVDPSPYYLQTTWDNGRFVLHRTGVVLEAHGARMVVAVSWNFLQGCLSFGNGPAFPGSIGDLAARGHEISYHDHGGVTLQVATQTIQNLTAPYTTASYPTNLEGGGDLATLGALGYLTTGSLCGKDIPTQLSGIFQNPVRRSATSCYGEDPTGPIIGLASGSADGSGRASDNVGEITAAIQYHISNHQPGKLSFITTGQAHPDNWVNATYPQILADMQVIDAWLTSDIDPLIASGVLQWKTAIEKAQLFNAWEAAGGTNADLFPAPNVTDPSWSYLDDTNAPFGTDQIDEVFVDSQDRLWVGGGNDDGLGGLFMLDGTTWTTITPTNSPLRSHRVVSIAEGPPGTLWVVTAKDATSGPQGTAIHRFDGTSWSVFDSSNSFGTAEVFLFDLSVDDAGVVWVGGKRFLHRYDGTTWSKYGATSPGMTAHTGINAVVPKNSNVIWLALRNGGVVRFNHGGDGLAANDTSVIHTRTSTGGSLPADTNYAIALHPNGSVFVGSRRGLSILDGGVWSLHQRASSELGYDQITDISIDVIGDAWMATYGGGLSRFRPSLNRFEHHDIPDGSVHARLLTSVATASNGTVYASSFVTGGISVYEPETLALFAHPDPGESLGLTILEPLHASASYIVAAAFSANTGLALPFPDPRVFPLDNDLLLALSLMGSVTEFGAFQGTLDSAGTARPFIAIPNIPNLTGFSFFVSGVTLDSSAPSGIATVYPAIEITL